MKDTTKKTWKDKPVKVDWIDSMNTSGWCDYTVTDMECTTVGLYYAETDERIVIAMNVSHDSKTYGNYMEIPKCAIKKITRLK